MSKEPWERLKGWAQERDTVAISTDVDGVLVATVPTPDMSEILEELRELLQRLGVRYRVVAGVSIRTAEDAFRLVRLKELVYYGNHGFEISHSGEVEVIPDVEPYRAATEELEEKALQKLGSLGAFVEEKGITASIHYRNVPPEMSERCKAFVESEGKRLGRRVTVGRGVIEARPPIRANKGTAVRCLIEEYEPEKMLFIRRRHHRPRRLPGARSSTQKRHALGDIADRGKKRGRCATARFRGRSRGGGDGGSRRGAASSG
jgi:trehalose 6-phosphate phosphatase